MGRRRSRATAGHGGDVAGVLEGERELQVEVAVRDRGESETGLGSIVQVGADGGKVDERHFDFATVAIKLYRRRFGEEREWWN
jgi:hypothetical protein